MTESEHEYEVVPLLNPGDKIEVDGRALTFKCLSPNAPQIVMCVDETGRSVEVVTDPDRSRFTKWRVKGSQ